jgi:hypothetical protein
MGDYNLVGSKTPLLRLEEVGLNEFMCVAGDASSYTWRGLKRDESFWPGRLDLVCTDQIGAISGFVFDSSRPVRDLPLQGDVKDDDSEASDHLMLVVDVVPRD